MSTTLDDVQRKLAEPFHPDEVEWRVQQAGFPASGNPYCMVIPYITSRAVQKRLDDVFGVFGWENAYKPSPDGKGYLCGITVTIGEKSVTKWDGAEYTNIEALKGALSDSMKRAAVQLGIGRYLYQLDAVFAVCEEVKTRRDAVNLHVHYPDKRNKQNARYISWFTPDLPPWAVPQKDYTPFLSAIQSAETMSDLRSAFKNAYQAAQVNQDDDFESQAIKAKDKRKEEIAANLTQYRDGKITELTTWVTNEAKMFAELPTESTINNFSLKIKNELTQKSSQFDFDCKPAFDELDRLTKERIAKVKSKR